MLKRALIFVHKWLGVVLALLFVMWFVSGLVLYYVPFPSLTQSERLAALPALQLPPDCCLTAQEAGKRASLRFTEARLGMQAGLPVWRLLAALAVPGKASAAPEVGEGRAAAHWVMLDARTAAVLAPLSMEATRAVAEVFSGERALSAVQVEADQWSTAQSLNAYRPLLHVTMDGPEGLELYVSPSTGEVLRDTRRMERFWNWIGAIPHWFYFSQLRDWSGARKNLVIWTASLGVVAAFSGLTLGIWQLFLNRTRWIPYRSFWPRWHHIAGLAAGVVTFTWILSGLLSVNPWGVFSARATPAAERARWLGAPGVATLDPSKALATARIASPDLKVKEIDMFRVGGQSWYRLRGASGQMLVRADETGETAGKVLPALPDDTVKTALLGLRQGEGAGVNDAGQPILVKLDAYDELYYSREYEADANKKFNKPLPVWRARWADGITLYADPASGRILMRQDGSSRWQRVFYNGLHSLDFSFLMARPWLRGGLIVLLSLFGTALCMTSCVMAWRALVPAARKSRATA